MFPGSYQQPYALSLLIKANIVPALRYSFLNVFQGVINRRDARNLSADRMVDRSADTAVAAEAVFVQEGEMAWRCVTNLP